MAEESAPLRRLLEKNVQWHWSDEHQKSLDSLKTLLTKAPVLKYYAINEPLVLSVDASSEGLGAVLLQSQQPVAYMPPSPSLNVKSDMRKSKRNF